MNKVFDLPPTPEEPQKVYGRVDPINGRIIWGNVRQKTDTHYGYVQGPYPLKECTHEHVITKMGEAWGSEVIEYMCFDCKELLKPVKWEKAG